MILCIGEAVIDMFLKKAPSLGEVFYPLPGGCSYNTSIAAGRLGAPVAFLGRLSKNFFGEIQIKRLRDNNVKTNMLIRCEQNPILAIIKTEEGAEPQYAFYDEGTSDRLLSDGELRSCLQSAEEKITCVVFGSVSMNMEPIASTIESFILNISDYRTQTKYLDKPVIAFDPNIRPFMIKDRDAYLKRFEKLAGASDIAKISSEDFEYIFPGVEPEKALEKTLALGARLAIATLGPNGALALLKRDGQSVTKASAAGIQIGALADTVGAGDTFLGAFLAWLELRGKMSHNAIVNLSEEDLNAALVFANKAAAIVCTRYGAQPPAMEEMLADLDRDD
ncbi:MAG: carbohydrate kinase [Treponema sp.]|jgi:fructokinase|nr:carbohydrate kinase [Treponema sp.]